jgi:mannose-6-phosphate isomerase-like protein (cupin superfamily)
MRREPVWPRNGAPGADRRRSTTVPRWAILAAVSSAVFQPLPMLPGRAAQVWRHQPAYRRPRHFHEEPEVNAVVRGTASLGIGVRKLELAAGELVLLEPGQDHVLLEASPDLELLVVALRPALAERVRGGRPRVHKEKIVFTEVEMAGLRERSSALGELRDPVAVERQLGDLFAALADGARQKSSSPEA